MPPGVVTKKLADECAQAWGRALRMGLAYRHMSQKEFALKMGYKSSQSVSPWVNGRRVPSLPVTVKTAQVLDIPIHQLWYLGSVAYGSDVAALVRALMALNGGEAKATPTRGESSPGSLPVTRF